MELESQVLYALYELYKKNLISHEQKGMVKDMLISKDYIFIACIQECNNYFILQDRILELLRDQESPLNFTTLSPIKRIPICQFSRQRIKSVIQQSNQNTTQNRSRSNSLVAI